MKWNRSKLAVLAGLLSGSTWALADIPIQSGGSACVAGDSLVVAGGELASMPGVGVKMKLSPKHAASVKALEGKKIEVLGEPRRQADGSWSFSPVSDDVALKVIGACK